MRDYIHRNAPQFYYFILKFPFLEDSYIQQLSWSAKFIRLESFLTCAATFLLLLLLCHPYECDLLLGSAELFWSLTRNIVIVKCKAGQVTYRFNYKIHHIVYSTRKSTQILSN